MPGGVHRASLLPYAPPFVRRPKPATLIVLAAVAGCLVRARRVRRRRRDDLDHFDDRRGAVTAGRACEDAEQPEPKKVKLKEPKEEVQPGEKITATVKTNCGEFEFELDTDGVAEDGELVRLTWSTRASTTTRPSTAWSATS